MLTNRANNKHCKTISPLPYMKQLIDIADGKCQLVSKTRLFMTRQILVAKARATTLRLSTHDRSPTSFPHPVAS